MPCVNVFNLVSCRPHELPSIFFRDIFKTVVSLIQASTEDPKWQIDSLIKYSIDELNNFPRYST